MKKKSVKMVISAAGMAICLLCGSCGGFQPGEDTVWKPAAEKFAEVSEEVRNQMEQQRIHEAAERAARLESYRTCASGVIVEEQLSEEETEALFYASEIPEDVFARMDGISYVENDDIALSDLRYLRLLYVGFDRKTHVGELVANVQIADMLLEIFRILYDNGYQIEKMCLIDDYGGDDDAEASGGQAPGEVRAVEGGGVHGRRARLIREQDERPCRGAGICHGAVAEEAGAPPPGLGPADGRMADGGVRRKERAGAVRGGI